MTRKNKVVIGIGVLVVMGGLVTGCGSTPSQATPVAPAATPAPAPTPAATPQKSSLTADEAAYSLKIQDHAKRWVENNTKFTDLLTQGVKANDQNWVIDMAVSLTEMKSLADEAINITAPPRFAAVHAEYVNGMKEYKTVATELPNAIDAMDAAKITSLSKNMDAGNQHIQNATAKMKEVLNQLQQ